MREKRPDPSIGFCPLIKAICRTDCLFHESHQAQCPYTECGIKRTLRKLIQE